MRKIAVPVVCLLFLAVMFKFSLHNYHSDKLLNKKAVREDSNTNVRQGDGNAFEKAKIEFEVIQAP